MGGLRQQTSSNMQHRVLPWPPIRSETGIIWGLKFVPECPETPGHQPQTKHPLHSQACSSCSESLLCFCSKTAFASAIMYPSIIKSKWSDHSVHRVLFPNLPNLAWKLWDMQDHFKTAKQHGCVRHLLATSFRLTRLSSSRHAPFNQNADVRYYSTFRPEARKKMIP